MSNSSALLLQRGLVGAAGLPVPSSLVSSVPRAVFGGRTATPGHGQRVRSRRHHTERVVLPMERQEVPVDELRMCHLKTSREIDQIRYLREEIQLPASALVDPSFHDRERQKDEHGFVAAFDCRGISIGTIRLIPMDQGLAPCEAILGRQSFLPAHIYAAGWEVGRLVLAPQYRTSPEALKRCLFLTLLYLVRTTHVKNLFATCNPVLCRLYRRFGFSVLVKNACDNVVDSFSLIHGAVPEVLLALASNAAETALAEHELALVRNG
jgi:hypothetical protein